MDTFYLNKYKKYKNKYIYLKQLQTGGDDKTLYLFKAEWCNHCQNFKSIWTKLQGDIHNIQFITYDDQTHPEMMTKYNINGFPTLIYINEGNKIKYNDLLTYDKIVNFLQSN